MIPTKVAGLTVKEIAVAVNKTVDSVVKGIINVTGATKTLVAEDSGAVVTLNKADGIAITLPAAAVGLKFTFLVQTAVSGGNVVISCASGDSFIGSYAACLVTAGTELFLFSGASYNTITLNGGTTGGDKGTYLELEAISDTLWLVSGVVQCTDAQAKAFSTV